MFPGLLLIAEIRVPNYAGPVQLESLHMELSRDIFEVVGGANIFLPIEEPIHRIDRSLDVDRVRLEPLRLGRDHDSVAFRAERAGAQPRSRLVQIARQIDRIGLRHFGDRFACRLGLEVEDLLDQVRYLLGSEGTDRSGEVQVSANLQIASRTQLLESLARTVFGIEQLI